MVGEELTESYNYALSFLGLWRLLVIAIVGLYFLATDLSPDLKRGLIDFIWIRETKRAGVLNNRVANG